MFVSNKDLKLWVQNIYYYYIVIIVEKYTYNYSIMVHYKLKVYKIHKISKHHGLLIVSSKYLVIFAAFKSA